MKRFEKVLIISILIISGVLIGNTMLKKADTQNATILIAVGNEVQERIPLKIQEESEIYEFKFKDNIGYLEVKNGKVRMLEMDREICPKAVCSDTGWIDSPSQAIICLPNQIIVTIKGMEHDGVSDII